MRYFFLINGGINPKGSSEKIFEHLPRKTTFGKIFKKPRMEVGGILVSLIAVLIFFGTLLYGIYLLLRSVTLPAYKYFRYTVFGSMYPEGFELYFNLLYNKFPYFRLLTDDEQKKFVSRLRYIRNNKNFSSRDSNLVLTEEMEILFSASVAQLTFGFSEFDLESFTELQLTATSFYSKLIERNVKGLTFESGRIVLSWADFEEGYRIGNDKLNLGLHELAHAFWISYFDTEGMEMYFDEWNTQALLELQRMRMGTDSDFFRDYASTNIEEFWACCVECFFEAAVEFKSKLPDLYRKMCEILNQDMAERMRGRLN